METDGPLHSSIPPPSLRFCFLMDPSLSLCPTLGHNASTIPNNAWPPPIKGLFWVVYMSGIRGQEKRFNTNIFVYCYKQAQVMIVYTMRSFMKAKMKWIIKSGRKFVEICVKRSLVGTGCFPCWSRKLRYVFDIFSYFWIWIIVILVTCSRLWENIWANSEYSGNIG